MVSLSSCPNLSLLSGAHTIPNISSVHLSDDDLSSAIHSWSISKEALSLSEAFSNLDEGTTMETDVDPLDPDLSASLNTDLIEWVRSSLHLFAAPR